MAQGLPPGGRDGRGPNDGGKNESDFTILTAAPVPSGTHDAPAQNRERASGAAGRLSRAADSSLQPLQYSHRTDAAGIPAALSAPSGSAIWVELPRQLPAVRQSAAGKSPPPLYAACCAALTAACHSGNPPRAARAMLHVVGATIFTSKPYDLIKFRQLPTPLLPLRSPQPVPESFRFAETSGTSSLSFSGRAIAAHLVAIAAASLVDVPERDAAAGSCLQTRGREGSC